jgi:CheY-like chemotaxis protein
LADPGRLSQILLNLLSNAVKFTEHGSVTLNAKVEEQLADGQVLLRFSIQDTGIGISPEELPLIFEAFKQAGENTHLQHSGTGLGLAISKQLVELQGGRMEAESTVGQGSVFHVLLPVGLAELPKNVESSAAETLQKLPSRKILLVEDNQFNQMLATELLQQLMENPQITLAENGIEAIEKAMAEAFDLIFMDIKMPRMDGFAATKALRANGLSTPIIALTANATSEEREKCLQSGLDDYLTKPIEVKLLRALIDKWVT